ncbi:MAG: tRNA (cytidine(56)-2'-O)-methyltransferase [Candidatus Bathyarchaeota archaeon]|nr:MAG: tRNA (cytidine(56)-2'-O)-methyltransferase [Candidatus Bathyarchaeota archaeon]
MAIHVLRLGHRSSRDKRVTTHLILAARALGASSATYDGERDPSLEESVRDVVTDWGGSFSLEYTDSWRRSIAAWRDERGGKVVHLTMYGIPLQDVISSIRDDPSDKLVVVGGAKVPGEAYSLADWNVSVTQQPHSEVSALAVFLHELLEGRELGRVFEGARLRVLPQEREKRVEERSPESKI